MTVSINFAGLSEVKMTKKVFLLILFIVAIINGYGQCLTDFAKLLPDKTPTYSETFGSVVSVYDDIIAVGAPNSDSLGLPSCGIVYLYQKTATSWNLLGVLKPSIPIAQAGFGSRLLVSENYILVGATTSNSGVYIYRKPAAGWQTAVETTLLKPVGTSSFGSSFNISDDEQSLVVTDITYSQGAGAFYVFHKQPIDEWNNSMTPQIVVNPDKNNGIIFFGIGGIQILGNKIACSTVSGFSGPNGTIYIFNDASGNFNDFQLEARLTETIGTSGSYGPDFIYSSEGIFKYLAGKLLYYEIPSSGTWQNSTPTCQYSFGLIDNIPLDNFYVNYTASGDALYFSMKMSDQSGTPIETKKSRVQIGAGHSYKKLYMRSRLLLKADQLYLFALSPVMMVRRLH